MNLEARTGMFRCLPCSRVPGSGAGALSLWLLGPHSTTARREKVLKESPEGRSHGNYRGQRQAIADEYNADYKDRHGFVNEGDGVWGISW